MTRRRAAAAGAALAALLAPELSFFGGWLLCAKPEPGPSCAVLVLGTASPGLRERRVAAGVDAMRRAGCERLVLTGGKPFTERPEADGMAEEALKLGVPADKMRLERTSRNTWENVGNSLPLLEGVERVYVVSDSLHAHRGKRFLCRRAPGLCAQARAVGYYRPFERPLGKFPGALHELGAYLRYR